MRPAVPLLCAALAATGAASLRCSLRADPAASPAAPAPAVLSKGTPIRVRLEMDLRSGRDKAGEPVLFTVDQNVYGPNHVLLLEKGALARGRVTVSDGHGAFGRAGRLTFTCDYARTDDGTRIPLHLVGAPGAGPGNRRPTAEIAASVSTGARGYDYPVGSPYGSPYGYDGGYEQQAGVAAGGSADLGNLLAGGDDVSAGRGQEYDAMVTGDTALAPAPPPAAPSEQLFTLQDKTQVAGTLTGFDGRSYTVQTPTGRRLLRAADVRSIQAVSPAP